MRVCDAVPFVCVQAIPFSLPASVNMSTSSVLFKSIHLSFLTIAPSVLRPRSTTTNQQKATNNKKK